MSDHGTLESAIDRVAALLHDHIGLRPDQNLRGRLRRAVREEASRHGQAPDSYVDRLAGDSDALQVLMNRVTVQETGFFRHPEQFVALAREVLPRLPQPVRLWSAACSNGQEAYSLAMVLDELGLDGDVIATDLSTAALQRTREARYHRREMTGLSPERVERHFQRVAADEWVVDPRVRDRVRAMRHNLLGPLPGQVLSTRVVFCRNVLIYLSPDQVRLLLDRIADDLDPGTTLFVGGAETIWQYSDRFSAVHLGDTFVYRRRSAAEAVAPPPGVERNPERRPERRTERPRPSQSPSRRPARQSSRVAETRHRVAPDAPRDLVPDGAAGGGRDAAFELLDRTGQEAIAVGDYAAAVVAFRKCAYLRPRDPLAQLHLGLALEATGDQAAAKRAFAAARRALESAGTDHPGLEGYAAEELMRLLDSKR